MEWIIAQSMYTTFFYEQTDVFQTYLGPLK